MFHPFFGLFVPKVKVYRVDSNTGQPLDPNASAPPASVHTDIKKDKHGKMVMVRHRSKNGSVVANDKENVTYKDVKKNKNGNGNDNKGKNNGGGDEKTDEGGKAGAAFTAEEDAKLKELKEANTPWKQIAQDMGRAQHELKARFKEIDGKPAAGGDQKKVDSGDGGGGDFSADDDKKIKELLESNTPYKQIAETLGRTLDKALKAQIGKLKAEVGGQGGGGGGGKKDDKKEDKKDSGAFSAEDDKKIKELLEAKTGYKKIATELGRNLDKDLKDHLEKLKAEIGDGGGEKKDEGGKKGKNKGGDGGGKKEEKQKNESKKDKDKSRKAASHTGSRRSEARFTMQEWMTLQEDDFFDFGELMLLSDIIVKVGDNDWLRVASAFHDQTGRRVHPDDIRDKFDEMAQMGRH